MSRLRISPPVVIRPPTSPVRPPLGMTGTPARAATLTTAETSAVEPGLATTRGFA